jgi:hypothetical protein
MACLEADPDWRPADLSYLLAVVRGLQQSQLPAPARTPPRRVVAPPRTFLESAQKRDDRGPLTRVLPIILVLVAILATGGAWLWFEVLRPRPEASSSKTPYPAAGVPSPPVTLAQASPLGGTPAEPVDAATAPSPAGALPAPTPSPSVAALVPGPPASPQARVASPTTPATLPPSAPASTPAPAASATPSAPPTPAHVEPVATAPVRPNPEPAAPTAGETSAAEAAPASGPASIRAIAPFRLRPGAMNVLDVHGTNLRAEHRAKVTIKREVAPGFGVTRYQLRSPALLLVFLQVDAGVRAGKYSFSLVGPGGDETNAFTIEVAGR